jgi:hypothetical protein
MSGGFSLEQDRAKNHETPPAFQSKGPKRYRIELTLEQRMREEKLFGDLKKVKHTIQFIENAGSIDFERVLMH